jgi:hypothetical protein
MVHFIQRNYNLEKELNFILDKNSIKYLISFHKKNINNLFFKKENFYNACFKNNLNIIKYIFHHLHNKNIDFNEALKYSCNQNNLKLINWLCKNQYLNIKNYYELLKYCIKYNNLKLFKFFTKKYKIDIFQNNNELLFESIHKKRYKFIHYLFSLNNNIQLINNYETTKSIFFTNDENVINLLITKINNFDIDYQTSPIIAYIVKSGFFNSLNHVLNYNSIYTFIKNNIYKFVYCSFESQNLDIIKKLLSIDSTIQLNYNFLFKRFIVYGNLKIISFLYENDNNINLFDYLSFEKILNNKFFDIFIFIIEKINLITLPERQKILFEQLINLHYLQIIINIKKSEILLFFDFISSNNINIKYSNILYITNNLLSYNQCEKINIIHNIFPDYLCYSSNTLLEDALKSHNLDCINYALNILNETIEDNKYQILYYSYIHGVNDIIYDLDDDNSFELTNYDTALIKNILKNNIEIINRLVLKKNMSINDLNHNIIDIIFQVGNSDILKIFLPLFGEDNIKNDDIIQKCIENNNFEMIKLLSTKINLNEIIVPNLITNICNHGNIVFMKWFMDFNLNINFYIKSCFNILIMYEHYEQAIYFYNYGNHKEYIDLIYNNFSLLKEIIRKNNFYMFQWVLNNFNDMNKIQFLIYLELQENIVQLIKYDNFEILSFVLNRFKIKNNNLIKILYKYAFSNYKIDTLTYLSTHFELKNYDLELDYKTIFFNSIKHNYYSVIDIIIKNVTKYSWLNIISYYENNNDTFLYLIEKYYDYLNINEETFYNILYTGNLECLKIFDKYYKGTINYDKINDDDYLILISYNNIELLDYIYNLNPNVSFNNNEYIIKLIVKLNKYEILKWYFNNFVFDDLHFDDNYLYYTAIVSKNINIIELLFENDNIDKFNQDLKKYINITSFVKDLYIFKWFENKLDDIDLTFYNKLIHNSIVSNNLIILKYLLDKNDIDINYDDGLIIRTAFGNNLNDIVEYLFEKYDNINVLVKNQIIMKYAIEDANLEMINLLYNYNSNFDLSIDTEYLFRIACKMEHIDVVKWLIDKKSDINYSINNHEIFYYVCEHNYIDIAEFYVELNSELYEIKVKDDEIIEYHVNKKIEINGELKVENIDKCPICLDENSKLITDCNHQFCEECLNNLNNKNIHFKCPLCRKDIISIKNLKL